MDENFEKKQHSDIDLSTFDLEPFREFFEEEDAQREAEEKARREQLEKKEAEIQAELDAQKKAELLEKQKAEQAAAEEEARLRAEREKEEARRAAQKEAEAVLAAKRAEEAERETNMEKSARLLERADVDDSLSPEAGEVKTEDTAEKAEKTEAEDSLEGFSSILSIDNDDSEDSESKREKIELTDEYFNYTPDMPSPKNGLYSAICALLIVAFLGCTGFAAYRYFFAGKDVKAAPSNTEYIGASPEYKPFADLQVKYPVTAYPQTVSDDLKALYSQNSDMVGWLSIDGTPVDFPIVQYGDNSHYLNAYNFYNKGARYGAPFMDYRCNSVLLSKNTVIYSHHMNNDLCFGSLDRYENSDYCKDHPCIDYQTLSGSFKFKIYAVFYATTQTDCDGGYVFDYYNPAMSDENFKGYIELLNQYAIYTTDAGLEATDKIITLSTCSHVYDNLRKGGVDTRFVVVGRMLRPGENDASNEVNITENTDYRRPQLWYDAGQKINPYSSYRTWKAAY